MTTLKLITKIKASKPTVFDLSRSIDLHQLSMKSSDEKAIAGKTSGLIELGETVTFKGKHFGFYLTHQSKITELTLYDSFTDEMQKGAFTSFKHKHLFEEEGQKILMIDLLQYEVPLGILGTIFDTLFLKQYLTRLIQKRNNFIKNLAEQQH